MAHTENCFRNNPKRRHLTAREGSQAEIGSRPYGAEGNTGLTRRAAGAEWGVTTNRKLFSALLLGWPWLLTAASAATLLVWPESPTPTAPYAEWARAAHAIQEAVDAAQPGDLILVTNGVYASGGRAVAGTMTNRVAVDKAVTVQSLNGPEVTHIVGWQMPGATLGEGAVRCAYLAVGAQLSGFTLAQGATALQQGGEGSGARPSPRWSATAC